MTDAPKNAADAQRLETMEHLIDPSNAKEFLRMAYALGHCQGQIDGMTQARDALAAESTPA